MATRYACDFLSDERFINAMQGRKGAEWISYIVFCAAEIGMELEGDFVECGVHKGFTARGVIEYTGFRGCDKTFWLLDTFDGLVPDQISAAEKLLGVDGYLTKYRNVFSEALQAFKTVPNARLIKGPVPDTLERVTCDRVAFLHIDMNCTAPSIAAAEFFWPKLSPGAWMLLDDYGSQIHAEQKRAFDLFAACRNMSVICLPTGQGVLIKPTIE